MRWREASEVAKHLRDIFEGVGTGAPDLALAQVRADRASNCLTLTGTARALRQVERLLGPAH